MPKRLNTTQSGFEAGFRQLLSARQEISAHISDRAAAVIRDVRLRGDAALFELTRALDGCVIDADTVFVSSGELDAAAKSVSADCRNAIATAACRIDAYHRMQVPRGHEQKSGSGEILGWRWNPIDSVGIYVPGGSASYPSSVLMNAIPARAAGVRDITMAVPAPGGAVNPLVLYAARCAGVEKILRIGGAQAIAALAYGTESIDPVDKITGPGNAYVTAAKRLVFGDVGIDLVAGPSEVAVIADGSGDPAWIAADLLAQAEHDSAAQSILLTDCPDLASAVEFHVEALLAELPRRDIASASWETHGAVIVTQGLEEAADLANRIAPEHLQICAAEAESVMNGIRHAGAIFVGSWTPEAIGDYIAGPNHVLPTTGTARFASGLSVLDFMKRTTVTVMTPASFAEIAPAAETLAIAEGLDAHARSLRVRIDALNEADHG